MNKLTIIGAGPGDGMYLTIQAKEMLNQANCVAAAKRHAPLVQMFAPGAKLLPLEPLSAGVAAIENALKFGDVAVLVSGDPTLFSLTKTLTKQIGIAKAEISVLPGIGAMNVLLSRLVESAEGAKVLSAHGRNLHPQSIAKMTAENECTIVFADAKHSPSWICEALTNCNLGDLDVAVGENLSYKEERIVRGRADSILGLSWSESSIVRIRNENAKKRDPAPMLHEAQFERGGKEKDGKPSVVPMTKEEIRMLSVCKLRLHDDATVWDIGAGTGSVAVQCARLITGMVYALEREGAGIALIRENSKKLGAHNLIAVHGSAPEGLRELPDPTHVFIGGTGGQLSSILEEIVRRGSGIRVVLNAVLPETAVDAARLMEEFVDFEMIQVQINVGKRTSSGHLMSAHNPVYIISATT